MVRLEKILKRSLLAAVITLGGYVGASAQQLTPLNIATIKVASQTPVWLAKERGIFAKNGIDAKITYFPPDGSVINGLQSGVADVGLAIAGVGLNAMSRGFEVTPIFQDEISQPKAPDTSGLHVMASSGIEKLTDLAGKKIAVGGVATQNTAMLKSLLKKAGVDLKTVQFIELPFPSHLAALKAGQVDASNATDPFTTQIRTAEGVKTLAYHYLEIAPEQPLGVWFARIKFLKEHPEQVAAFTRSLREAIEFLKADPAVARQEVAKFTGIAPSILEQMPLSNWNFDVRPDKWQAVIDVLHENGILPETKPAATYFSSQIKEFVVSK